MCFNLNFGLNIYHVDLDSWELLTVINLFSLKSDLQVPRVEPMGMAGTPTQLPLESLPQSLHPGRPPDLPLDLSLLPARGTRVRAKSRLEKQRRTKLLN